jgi:hypothetical protein
VTAEEITVSSGYIRTVEGRILEGRDLASTDRDSEVLLNETAARSLWPTQSALHQRLQLILPARFGLGSSQRTVRVVGLIKDMKPPGHARQVLPAVYSSALKAGYTDFTPKLILNGTVTRAAIEAAMGKEVQVQLPGMSIRSIDSLRERVNSIFAAEARGSYLAIAAALVMSAVSWIGLYASLAQFLRSHRRELSIRVCLGASSTSIRRIVYRRAVVHSSVGVGLSTAVWPFLARLSSVDYLGAVSWSPTIAISISICCIAASIAMARFAARQEDWISPYQLLKDN